MDVGPGLHVLHGDRETLSPEWGVRFKITVFGRCSESKGHTDTKPACLGAERNELKVNQVLSNMFANRDGTRAKRAEVSPEEAQALPAKLAKPRPTKAKVGAAG